VKLVGLLRFSFNLAAGPGANKKIFTPTGTVTTALWKSATKSASFGTGAFPPTIDLNQLARVEQWLLTKEPPKYPVPVDAHSARKAKTFTCNTAQTVTAGNGRDFSANPRRRRLCQSIKSALTVTRLDS